ncbi:MAG: PD-(D/E)XK nuclease superfamily protein [Gammaproteobacteria bacterium]|nr:PD-(D/E)XK nuclease superfamily protein [Gammaproteobacteria bacterium]MBU1556229.1 PD-(D/E)XK nuclease superfamily protein [Gammaproteobacteria bacterium]MBU2071548.1 PD-(D/E)XK nuclease superfamily protein [Gammaproteobacteria bacterium]MBU2184039.1 PD-(D/E)XK nuclease superfamily protein [Gammaproteobacteria bacterium]MBU2206875.1 PD-(D/E)XK nuclease superfamily protein [Gammaproteobacteria bacterium]
MEQLNTYLSLTERDVDLLLLEELLVSESFANWFVSEVTRQSSPIRIIGAWHSVSDALLGESDLIVKFEAAAGLTEAILIENKIDAAAQIEQGYRYKMRGEKGIANGEWVKFTTCLFAPQSYIDRNAEPYDVEISYEQVVAFFQTQADVRSRYRAAFLQEAVEKNRRGYQSVVCPRMTDFATAYLDFVACSYPELNPEIAKPRAAGHDWIHFYPIPNQKNIVIVHQIRGQRIKVIYHGQLSRYDEIADKFADVVDLPLTVKPSGKSVTVSTEAPFIDLANSTFEQVKGQIQLALNLALAIKNYLIR